MKKKMLFFIGITIAVLTVFDCNKANPATAKVDLDKEITGTWRYALYWNQDTTIHIVMTYDSGFTYKIHVDIDSTDTMERENGTWFIVSDAVSKEDTVWLSRHNCHQINLQTHTLDSVDCGVDTAGIKIDISPSVAKPAWTVPLDNFKSFLPSNLVPSGTVLPTVQFYRD